MSALTPTIDLVVPRSTWNAIAAPQAAAPSLGEILRALSDVTREIQEAEARLSHGKRDRGLLLMALREIYGDDAFLAALEALELPLETARGEVWVARRVPEALWDLGFSYSALKAAAALPAEELAPTLRRLRGEGRTTVAAVNAELRERALAALPPPPAASEAPQALEDWLLAYALRDWAGRFGPETACEMARGFAGAVQAWNKTNGRTRVDLSENTNPGEPHGDSA